MANAVILIIVLAITGAAGIYIYRAKKRGVKCIGCSSSDGCSKKGCSCCDSIAEIEKELLK